MSKMNFDEASHEYTKNGKTYISTTQLLQKYGLSANYANIPATVLAKAAQAGKAVHSALEAHIKGDPNMVSMFTEVKLFNNYMTLRGVDMATVESEKIVFDDTYGVAGTMDLKYEDNGSKVIADFKTTSQLHIDAVAWQLSIYNYMECGGDIIQYYFTKLKVFHFKNNKLSVKDVYTVEFDAIEDLFKAHITNAPYTYVASKSLVLPSQETLIEQLLNEKQQAEDILNKIKEEIALVQQSLMPVFQKQKKYSFQNQNISIAYVMGATKNSLNRKKVEAFLNKHGEDISDYMNITKGKDSMRFTLRKLKSNSSSSNNDDDDDDENE